MLIEPAWLTDELAILVGVSTEQTKDEILSERDNS